MSKYASVRGALNALEEAEIALHQAISAAFGPVAVARQPEPFSEPKVQAVQAKVIPITTDSDLVAKVRSAVEAAGVSLSQSDEDQLSALSAKLAGLRGKSEQEVVEALAGEGVLAIAV